MCVFIPSHFTPFLIVSIAGDLVWFNSDGKRFVYNEGDTAWVLASTALVWIMIPGVGFFYSGLLRRKNALSMIYLSMMTMAVVSFQVHHITNLFTTLLRLIFSAVVLLGVLSHIQ
jgi:hypothetical protein